VRVKSLNEDFLYEMVLENRQRSRHRRIFAHDLPDPDRLDRARLLATGWYGGCGGCGCGLYPGFVFLEFGHALTARQFGIRTKSIMLLPIGGIASIEKMPEDPRHEIIIALAGPAVSFAIALLLWILLKMGNGLVPLEDLSVTGGSFLQRLMIVNILLAAFNLLPAFPMDGGRVFRALLSLRMEPVKATRIAAVVAQAFALLMAVLGFRYNLFLVFIAVFIWIGAVADRLPGSAARSVIGPGSEADPVRNPKRLSRACWR